jgi:hypothetical protein
MQSDLLLHSLREQVAESDTRLLELERKLKEFCCARDKDVESFIHDKAIRYERSGLSRTYYCTTRRTVCGVDRTDVVAYFSIAITSIDFSDVSRSCRARVLGGTPGRTSRDHFGGLLIAQLARDDKFDNEVISGAELIEICEGVIESGRNILGGRVIYLDCREELISLYERNGYKLMLDVPFDDNLYKMAKPLPRL